VFHIMKSVSKRNKKSEPKVTARQIADISGLSTATVSRVLNDKSAVDNNSRRKVLDAMKRLNYAGNASESDPDSRSILLFLPRFDNPVMNILTNGIKKTALSNGYRLLILLSQGEVLNFEDYDYAMKNHSFAGIILISSTDNPELLELLSLRCPIVMCSNYTEEKGVSFVGVDDTASARCATEYLIACGCKRIALLNMRLTGRFARDREKGYIDALKAAGREYREEYTAHIQDISFDLACSYTADILSGPNPPDGIFAVSDLFAAGAVRAAKKLGRRVPEDVAVIGFDDIPFASMIDPPLTTMRQPLESIGNRACELILEKIANPGVPKRRIILETELVIRGTTPDLRLRTE
jgi:DNA-binding LacI/PurR family transcriptional regulator